MFEIKQQPLFVRSIAVFALDIVRDGQALRVRDGACALVTGGFLLIIKKRRSHRHLVKTSFEYITDNNENKNM